MEWRPIETAPIWEAVIVFDPKASKRRSGSFVNTAVKTEDGRWVLGGQNYQPIAPTHWMPLPEPPPLNRSQ